MSEQSMKCKDCVLKHIANAMSYAKEILAGHGIGGTPDHRPDYLGELTNAEHHLEHISVELLNRVMVIRTAAQMRRMIPTDSEIDQLRELWIDVEAFEVPEGAVMVASMAQTEWVKQDGSKIELPERKITEPILTYGSYPDLEKMGKVGIVLADEWTREENKEKFSLFMKLLEKHMKNGELISRGDLEKYEGKYLWVIPFNCFVALPANMKVPLQATVSEGRKPSFMPRLVEMEKYKEAAEDISINDPVDILDKMVLPILPPVTREDQVMVYVTKKPCCSIKTRLRTTPFVKVDDNGWPYMKEFWEAEFEDRPVNITEKEK